ncbi:uncharacterized protein LOC133193255 [Saccostrea echinata]|uniref:uncharacterized protein LOC133193255 n=1 Tax=Saccostrea echinata TaxID=191078 RepID=UPI002A823074|nr:uncharacterized protein LOC133193255 [Saccostrea echinata]
MYFFYADIGNLTTNGTNGYCYDNTYTWPFYEIGNFRTEIPHIVEFEAQRTASYLYFYLWEPYSNTVEIELCEIEITGCEVDHYGEDCLPCNKSDNCEVCDVNNGACYVCRENYTGPDCSINNENVALQTDTWLYYSDSFLYYMYLPSHRLFDGSTTQPSCIDFTSSWTGKTYYLDMYV